MKYLLDSDTCIYLIKKEYPKLLERIKRHSPENVYISSITIGELKYGIEKSRFPEKNLKILEEFLSPFEKISYSVIHTNSFAQLRADLERRGKIIGAYDMMIASIAKSEHMTLVSNNTKEFSKIGGLKLENWV